MVAWENQTPFTSALAAGYTVPAASSATGIMFQAQPVLGSPTPDKDAEGLSSGIGRRWLRARTMKSECLASDPYPQSLAVWS